MADQKISELANAGALTGAEEVPMTQGGATVAGTTAAIAALAVEDAINNGETAKAPSENAVFDALAGKSNTGHTHVAADVTDFDSAAKAAAVEDAINNGVTDKAPSQNAVFDALAAITPGASDINGLSDGFSDGNFNLYMGANAGGATPGSGGVNTGVGQSALLAITTGGANAAYGEQAMKALTTGGDNTAMGRAAGFGLTTGSNNTFLGQAAGYNITTGSNNIMIGDDLAADDAAGNNQLNIGGALKGDLSSKILQLQGNLDANSKSIFNLDDPTNPQDAATKQYVDDNAGGGATDINGLSDGFVSAENILLGDATQGASLAGGYQNTGVGKGALVAVTSGGQNTAFGAFALNVMTTGTKNVVIGDSSGGALTTGSGNTFIGSLAAANGTTGSNNVVIGNDAINVNFTLGTGSNNIVIGYQQDIPADNASNSLNIGGVIKGTLTGEKNIVLPGTGALQVHKGTAAERPATPTNGQIRYNTDTDTLEAYIAGTWKTITAV